MRSMTWMMIPMRATSRRRWTVTRSSYKKMRPGDPATLDSARSLVKSLFFNARRYDLGDVGRYKLNRKLDLLIPQDHRTLTLDDLVSIIRRLIQLNNGHGREDDIDHLGNRRVRRVGELIQA